MWHSGAQEGDRCVCFYVCVCVCMVEEEIWELIWNLRAHFKYTRDCNKSSFPDKSFKKSSIVFSYLILKLKNVPTKKTNELCLVEEGCHCLNTSTSIGWVRQGHNSGVCIHPVAVWPTALPVLWKGFLLNLMESCCFQRSESKRVSVGVSKHFSLCVIDCVCVCLF